MSGHRFLVVDPASPLTNLDESPPMPAPANSRDFKNSRDGRVTALVKVTRQVGLAHVNVVIWAVWFGSPDVTLNKTSREPKVR